MAGDLVTFMVTDIVGSTERWSSDAQTMSLAQLEHDTIVSRAMRDSHGEIVRHTGDGFIALFRDSLDAAHGALACQDEITRAEWPGPPLDIRVAMHTGTAEEREGNYFGVSVNCAARLNAVAHGGQILLTGETRQALADRLPSSEHLKGLGRVRLRGIAEPVDVFQLSDSNDAADFGPLAGRLGSPLLTDPLNPLVGRERELALLLETIERHRVVNILGPGGMGKTRLAHAVAQQLQRQSALALWWCELASIEDPERVPDALAGVVGFSDRRGRDVVDALIALFGEGEVIVVLDNAEHVVAGVANLVRRLVNECPGLRVLCTSREALAITGERTVSLDPLDVEDATNGDHGPAVALFAVRAAAADASFTLNESNLEQVTELCRRLDGLPLALEIAAARTRTLGVDEILRHIDQRFRLLRWDRRDKDARHQSVEAAIEWTYDMTPPEDRALFECLSVFGADFDLAAVNAISGNLGGELATLDTLDRLIGRSLVVRNEGDRPRYRLLESLRDFGRDRLDATSDATAVRGRWASHYVGLAEAGAHGLCGAQDATWVGRLDAEFTNFRLVHHYALDHGDLDLALRLCAALSDFAFFRLCLEVGEWAAQALALPEARSHPLFGEVCGAAAGLAWASGFVDRARPFAQAGVAADPTSWVAHQSLGTIALFEGDLAAATEAWETACAAAAAKDDAFHELISEGQVLFARHLGGDPDVALGAGALKERAEQLDNTQAKAFASWVLGIALSKQDPWAALEEFDRSLDFSQEIGSELMIGSVIDPAAQVRRRLARSSIDENVGQVLDRAHYWTRVGNTPNQWRAVMDFIAVLGNLGFLQEAATLYGAWDHAPLKISSYGAEAVRLERLVGAMRAELGEAGFAAAVAEGGRLDQAELLRAMERYARAAATR